MADPISSSALRAAGIEADDADTAAGLVSLINEKAFRNERRDRFYQGRERIKSLGIAVPESLSCLETVVGWPAMVVDVLEERLDIEGFALPGASTSDEGIDEIWRSNAMPVKSGLAHTDTMIYGVEFLAASVGGEDEPNPLITIEPPTRMSGDWDARKNRLRSACSVINENINGTLVTVGATLYMPDYTIWLQRDGSGAPWEVTDFNDHNLGRVPVVRMVNRPRSGRPWGQSEITRAVMGYTANAVRTLLGTEVAREFFSVPQRAILGVSEDAFRDKDGNTISAWQTYIGSILALTRDEESGQLPEVHQFTPGSPAPFLDIIRFLAQMLAAEAAMPASYLGFQTDNPSSADAIRAGEARLVKRAERRQRVYGAAWCEVIRLGMMLRDPGKRLPDGIDNLTALWGDAGTPTKAASADAVMKLISAGVLPPDSEVTYELLGFSDSTKDRLLADARRVRASATLSALSAAQATVVPQSAQLAAVRTNGDTSVTDTRA